MSRAEQLELVREASSRIVGPYDLELELLQLPVFWDSDLSRSRLRREEPSEVEQAVLDIAKDEVIDQGEPNRALFRHHYDGAEIIDIKFNQQPDDSITQETCVHAEGPKRHTEHHSDDADSLGLTPIDNNEVSSVATGHLDSHSVVSNSKRSSKPATQLCLPTVRDTIHQTAASLVIPHGSPCSGQLESRKGTNRPETNVQHLEISQSLQLLGTLTEALHEYEEWGSMICDEMEFLDFRLTQERDVSDQPWPHTPSLGDVAKLRFRNHCLMSSTLMPALCMSLYSLIRYLDTILTANRKGCGGNSGPFERGLDQRQSSRHYAVSLNDNTKYNASCNDDHSSSPKPSLTKYRPESCAVEVMSGNQRDDDWTDSDMPRHIPKYHRSSSSQKSRSPPVTSSAAQRDPPGNVYETQEESNRLIHRSLAIFQALRTSLNSLNVPDDSLSTSRSTREEFKMYLLTPTQCTARRLSLEE
eukprot:GHVT01040257.1.p1 GENE.GHVT01040257.1~~GHVT01040257.1.p1  ORF type:complete len:472 (-),score=22.68 GHVT01040257.1:288-1703(-)